MSDPRVTVELLARATFAPKATLSEAWGKQWQDVLNDVGFGKCTLANNDADLALVEYGDFLRFSIDGTPRFLSIVEAKSRTDIAQGEEVDEATEISGRGALAYFEDGVVYPDFFIFNDKAPFSDARVWNFGCFDAVSTGQFGGSPYDYGDRFSGGNYDGIPRDFPFIFAHWLGPQAPDGSGNNPVGDWYMECLIFGLPADLYRLYIGYDDAIDLWVDNVPILQNEGSTVDITKTVDLYLDDTAIHFINVRVSNRSNPSPNPTAIVMALTTLNPDSSPDVEYWATDPTNTDIYVAAYPADAPAFTVGFIADALCRYEPSFSGRDALELATMGFTDTHDSDGVAWSARINPSFQIGMDCLTMLKQLAESYCDIWVDPATLTLNLYQTRGQVSGASFSEAVNITDLKHDGKF